MNRVGLFPARLRRAKDDDASRFAIPWLKLPSRTGPFPGNPAAVLRLPAWPDDGWLQQVAMEMNLFRKRHSWSDQADGYRLRWFTPAVEVALCGHATLAASHVLWSEGHAKATEELRFHTKSGLLRAIKKESRIELDFPIEPPSESPPPAGLLEALGTTARYVGRNRFDYLVEVDSEAEIRRLSPDFARLGRVETRGVIVTSRSANPQYDFVSHVSSPLGPPS